MLFPCACCLECKSQFAAAGLKGSEAADRPAEQEQHKEEEQSAPSGGQDDDPSSSEAADMTANSVPNGRTLTQLRYTVTRNQQLVVLLILTSSCLLDQNIAFLPQTPACLKVWF